MHSESCCIKNVKVDFSSCNDMIGCHIRKTTINFDTVSMVRIQVNVFLSGPMQKHSTMEAVLTFRGTQRQFLENICSEDDLIEI